jgi:hemin uptake protein HemP
MTQKPNPTKDLSTVRIPTPVLESAALFQGAAEIVIRHGGREYRLRKTRLDKLILTA